MKVNWFWNTDDHENPNFPVWRQLNNYWCGVWYLAGLLVFNDEAIGALFRRLIPRYWIFN